MLCPRKKQSLLTSSLRARCPLTDLYATQLRWGTPTVTLALHLYKKLQKYLVDTLTLSSVTENDTWQKMVEYLCRNRSKSRNLVFCEFINGINFCSNSGNLGSNL